MSETVPTPQSSMILYQTEDGQTRIECRFEADTIWLTQKLMAELFQKDVRTINEHIQNVLAEGELPAESVIRNFRITAADGKGYDTQHYTLHMILAVGYRVKSPRGTQFRQWATARLSEYLVKGFTMDDARLKNPPGPGVPDYFDELLERIRDIRASEKRMYLRVREILALAADYQAADNETQLVFKTMQNKLHFAATGQTAPGINRIVVMFLDFAEDQARRRKQVFLKDWQAKLDEFLRFNDRNVLPDAGNVSRESADEKATQEYERFSERRRTEIEAQAEHDAIAELEDTAKKLEKKPKTRKKKPKGDQP